MKNYEVSLKNPIFKEGVDCLRIKGKDLAEKRGGGVLREEGGLIPQCTL